MAKIFIRNIQNYIEVDSEDEHRVSLYTWHMNKNYDNLRVLGFVDGKKVALPHYITGKENAYQKVKGLDFRKSNIGIDNHKSRYRKPQKNSSSIYKGVRCMNLKSGNKTWCASISVDGKVKHLGCFDTEIRAAIEYNQAVKRYWNGNGYLNLIE